MVFGRAMLIQSNYLLSTREEMLEFIINNPKTILEVGCREGLFTKQVKEKFDIKDSWGIEPDASIEKSAKLNIDNVIIDFFGKDTDIPENYFDLIVFNDVLEHMYDPWEALIKSKSLLSDNGIVIVSLPNIRHKSVLKDLFFNDNFLYKSAGILDVTHIRFFTKKTMIQLFEETGYRIVKMKPVILIKKKRSYKIITNLPKMIFNFITLNKFESLQYAQYAFTLKKS